MGFGGHTLTKGAVSILIIAVGFGHGVAVPATGHPTESGERATDQFVTPTADIEYTCDNVTVSVKPKWVNYSIVVYYRDTVTGDEGKALLGPMNGTVTEPYGPDILFTSVEVIVNGGIIATDYILARCTPDTSERTRSARSARGIDCGAVGIAPCSRNPVPVAIATT
ncbi:hypothetical protein SAMN05421858_3928 [Haladaptatus litoreus]|uniref:Uncharacterized protein n=1 Tax=Haladaptatus litoreus TaxID=553468 RepID=A0A1N7E0X6_9EURY|nr:hypothetical protein SAMN05421858_3928 [Haladaptatus litoreus]